MHVINGKNWNITKDKGSYEHSRRYVWASYLRIYDCMYAGICVCVPWKHKNAVLFWKGMHVVQASI